MGPSASRGQGCEPVLSDTVGLKEREGWGSCGQWGNQRPEGQLLRRGDLAPTRLQGLGFLIHAITVLTARTKESKREKC